MFFGTWELMEFILHQKINHLQSSDPYALSLRLQQCSEVGIQEWTVK